MGLLKRKLVTADMCGMEVYNMSTTTKLLKQLPTILYLDPRGQRDIALQHTWQHTWRQGTTDTKRKKMVGKLPLIIYVSNTA